MAIDKKIEELFDSFGEKLVPDLQESLRKKGVTYGGGDSRLSNKIRFKTIQTSDKITFQLLMPDYGLIRDKGRGKTKNDDGGTVKEKITDWVKRKAIVGKFQNEMLRKAKEVSPRSKAKKIPFEKAAKQLAFLISRKIHRKGYKGNNFFTDVIEDGRLKELEKGLSELIKNEVIIEIKK